MMTTPLSSDLGFGLGLRVPHYQSILNSNPNIDWLEINSENFMVPGGRPLHYLAQFRERYPIVMHGVSMSIGSTDELNWDYLAKLKKLIDWLDPAWVSDHLCWTGVDHLNLHDLMPLPYTEEAIQHIEQRLQIVQDYLGRQILLENLSSYITYKSSIMTEWEFLTAVAEAADCLILLDINNIYVSSVNHNFNPHDYLNAIPVNRVQQFHLAGHMRKDNLIIDTHDHDIVDDVWQLYADAVERFGRVATMIERDDNIPPLDELIEELELARLISARVLKQKQDSEVVA